MAGREKVYKAAAGNSLDDLVSGGKAKISGDKAAIAKLDSIFALDSKSNMNLVLPLQPENRVQ
jgi:hypothetical protein